MGKISHFFLGNINSRRDKTKYVSQAAVICATYTVLTLVSGLVGLASGPIQIRISEALVILPAFYPAAIPGLFLGCFLSNLLTGCFIADIIFGSLTTLLAAIITRMIRNNTVLLPFPAIIANTITIPLILAYAYRLGDSAIAYYPTVFIGEFISAGVLGTLLLRGMKHAGLIKVNTEKNK